MSLNTRFSRIVHPPPYLEKQIRPAIRRNNMNAEVVWTYLLARRYENDLPAQKKKENIGRLGQTLPSVVLNMSAANTGKSGLMEIGFALPNQNGSMIFIKTRDSRKSINYRR